jgi:hypothetical protein
VANQAVFLWQIKRNFCEASAHCLEAEGSAIEAMLFFVSVGVHESAPLLPKTAQNDVTPKSWTQQGVQHEEKI